MGEQEKDQNTAQNHENKEVLMGREGGVFSNIFFKQYVNKKGEITWKSSAKDRKIIILSPLSETPEESKPYKVLVVEDTNPDDPMDGKMIVQIVPAELGESEALDLTIKTKHTIEELKNEGKLSPEDRERISALLQKCIEMNVSCDPDVTYLNTEEYEIYDPDTDEGWEERDEDGFVVNNNYRIKTNSEKEILKARAKEIIQLRRQLRAEGPKIISFMLEYGRSAGADFSILYEYSNLIHYASTPRDSKKVVDFFNLDKIAKSKDRSAKENIGLVMSRIGSVKDLEYLKSFLNKTLKSKYTSHYNETNYEYLINDAQIIAYIMIEMRERTKDPREIEKINDAFSLIQQKILDLGGDWYDVTPFGPEHISKKYDEEFMDAEIKFERGKLFHYLERYIPNEEDLETKILSFKDLLDKHHEGEMFAEIIQEACWKITVRESDVKLVDGLPLSERVNLIASITNITPEFKANDSRIQHYYQTELLENLQSFKQHQDSSKRFHQLTEVNFKIDSIEIQQKILDFIEDNPEDALDFASHISEIAGAKLSLDLIQDKIQEIYIKIFRNADCYKIIKRTRAYQYDDQNLERAEILHKITGITPQISKHDMQELYAKWIEEFEEGVELVIVAESITKIKPALQIIINVTQTSQVDNKSVTVLLYEYGNKNKYIRGAPRKMASC